MSSSSTDTSRTASVTGGVQRVSTIRGRSASVTPETSFTVCACVASWYSASSSADAVAAPTSAACAAVCP